MEVEKLVALETFKMFLRIVSLGLIKLWDKFQMVAVIPKCHSNGCCHSKWLLSFQNVKVFKLIIKTYVTYFQRNIKTQGITTVETSKLDGFYYFR